jgi:hypothetical protein
MEVFLLRQNEPIKINQQTLHLAILEQKRLKPKIKISSPFCLSKTKNRQSNKARNKINHNGFNSSEQIT